MRALKEAMIHRKEFMDEPVAPKMSRLLFAMSAREVKRPLPGPVA
jgi:hypothetical protein